MRSSVKTLLMAAFLTHVGAAYAQDETAAPAETTTETDSSAESALDLGQSSEPAVGQSYVLQEFGDWAMRCIRAPEGEADPCNLYQLLKDDEGNAIAEFNFFRLPPDAGPVAGANVVVPLETLLTQQLTIAVDGQNPRVYPFRFCNAGGCVARLGFTQEDIDLFKRGSTATVRVVPAADPAQEILLDLSLTGFTAGYEGSVGSTQ